METTPSLACANKCTFCESRHLRITSIADPERTDGGHNIGWRSHSNPVGVTWRWKIDDADFLVDGALKEHDRSRSAVHPYTILQSSMERLIISLSPVQ